MKRLKTKHPLGQSTKSNHCAISRESIRFLEDEKIDPRIKCKVVWDYTIISIDPKVPQEIKNNIPKALREERQKHRGKS